MQPVSNVLRDPLVTGTDRRDDTTTDSDAMPATALAKLQTRTMDSLAGFDKMLEKAEPHFRTTVQSFIDLHRTHADALGRMLIERGHELDADGSWMSTMQRTVIAMRSVVDDIDEGTLPQVRMGEEQLIALYDKAIEETSDETQRRELVVMRAEVASLTDRLAPAT